jgi:energy-coupling factor transporter ATP-binding protein EcfA2
MNHNTPLFLKHYAHLLEDDEIFEIFFPGTARSTPESRHNDVIVITGRKGSGKSELAKTMAYIYHQELPKNRVIVFSGIRDLYNDLPFAKKVDLKQVEEEEQERQRTDFSGMPDVSEFRNSLVIFDDTEKYPNPKIEKMLYQLMNIIAMNGRNFGVNLIIILHQLNKGIQSTTLLREADSLVIFPRSFDFNTFNTLVNHFGFSRDQARFLFNYRDEWFIYIHHSRPSYVYLGTSGEKIDTE